MNKAECPKCHKHKVYAEHRFGEDYSNNRWRIFCKYCGRETIWCNTHFEAIKEWDQIKDGESK